MTCVEPDAPIMQCCMCGGPVRTCEKQVTDEGSNSYLCPEHPDGCQLVDGRWTCCEHCYDVAVILKEEQCVLLKNTHALYLMLLAFLLGALLPWILM